MYQLAKKPPHRCKSTLQSVELGNIHGHGWKDRLKISNLAEFGTDLLLKEDRVPQSRQILDAFVWWG